MAEVCSHLLCLDRDDRGEGLSVEARGMVYDIVAGNRLEVAFEPVLLE